MGGEGRREDLEGGRVERREDLGEGRAKMQELRLEKRLEQRLEQRRLAAASRKNIAPALHCTPLVHARVADH